MSLCRWVNVYQSSIAGHGDYFNTLLGTPGTLLVLNNNVFLQEPLNITIMSKSQSVVYQTVVSPRCTESDLEHTENLFNIATHNHTCKILRDVY